MNRISRIALLITGVATVSGVAAPAFAATAVTTAKPAVVSSVAGKAKAAVAAPVVTPTKVAAVAPAKVAAVTPAKAATNSGSINVNTATRAQLIAVKGIGPKMATAIIAHRPYKDIAGLETGLGKSFLVALKAVESKLVV